MFKAYNASAGSGKTTNLVIEYLSLCFLNIKNFRHVLAITFTNNATAEMKERIIHYLELFAFTDYAQILKFSDKILYDEVLYRCQGPKAELKNRALAEKFMKEQSLILLKEILYDYNNFSISTIDSFFQRILRAFAYDLQLNLNYNVEINLAELYSQAIDLLLNKISEQEKELSERIIGIVNKQLEDTGKWKVEKALIEILNDYIYKEQCYQPLHELETIDSKDFHSACEEFKLNHNRKLKGLKDKAHSLAKEADKLLKSIGDASEYKKGTMGIYEWFNKTQKKFPEVPLTNTINEHIEEGSFTKKGIDSIHFDKICQYIDEIQEYGKEYQKIKCIGSEIEKLIILFDLKGIMDDIKLRDNLFFLAESNAKIHEEIADEDTPYIYEKIGNKYKYFFIDEFQDTSKMQWNNLLPLVKNALAEGGETIIFGDLKQAIYRFRGGDKDLFDKLSDEEKFKGQGIPTSFERVSLKNNHRSSISIINFNNGCFKKLGDEYSFFNETQEIDENNTTKGFVQINFKPKGKNKEEYLFPTLLTDVKDALAKGFDYKDIAILTKGNDLGNQIAQFLSAEGHPVISADSLLLSSSKEVILIINTLQYLNNPEDKLSQLYIWNYLINSNKQDLSSFEGIEEISKGHFAQLLKKTFNIEHDRQWLNSLPLYTLVKEIMRSYQLSANDAYIIRFLDALLDYSEKTDNDLSQFLVWWENKQEKLSVVSSKDDNAITVTTIHKAKGLGYPVVIIPMMSYQSMKSTTLWYKTTPDDQTSLPYIPVKLKKEMTEIPDLAPLYNDEQNSCEIDNYNTIYVAQTRAREVMYIITSERNSSSNYAFFLSSFINDVKDELGKDTDDEVIYGDPNYTHSKAQSETFNDNISISKIYINDFSLSKLLKKEAAPTEQQERGLAIHDYLASIKNFPQNETEIDNLNIDLDEKYIPLAKKILLQIIQDEEIKPYLMPDVEVLNEINIVDKEGKSHRPDRVMILNNKVLIIDYKTGHAQKEYETQLNNYISLIQEMGYDNVQGKLIYIDKD